MTGVLAAAIASPSFGDVSLGMPQPSITTGEVSYRQLGVEIAIVLSTAFCSTLTMLKGFVAPESCNSEVSLSLVNEIWTRPTRDCNFQESMVQGEE